MDLSPGEVKYFRRSRAFIPTFWSRFPSDCLDFEGKRILEVGAGYGDLCLDMALRGAHKVVGIDIKGEKTEAAENILHQDHKHLEERITYKHCEVSDLPEDPFDLIVSKNTFEHIMDPVSCLEEMKERLVPGGKVLIGFSPLYNSPFGDHGKTHTVIPWGHLIFPEYWIVRRLNKKGMTPPIERIEELELNKYSVQQWKELFYSSGFHVQSLEVNAGRNVLLHFASLVQRISFLEEYFSINLFVAMVNS